jgi:hypothetical protein
MATATGPRNLLNEHEADGLMAMLGNPGASEEGVLDDISPTPAVRYIIGSF